MRVMQFSCCLPRELLLLSGEKLRATGPEMLYALGEGILREEQAPMNVNIQGGVR
jgi:hypothetical protein